VDPIQTNPLMNLKSLEVVPTFSSTFDLKGHVFLSSLGYSSSEKKMKMAIQVKELEYVMFEF